MNEKKNSSVGRRLDYNPLFLFLLIERPYEVCLKFCFSPYGNPITLFELS